MLVHRLNCYSSGPLRVVELQGDPHGELVVLRTHNSKILLCQVMALMRYFEMYRQVFKATKSYSFREELPCCLEIIPTSTQNIFKVGLSERQGQYQILAIFYTKLIETVVFHAKDKTIKYRQSYQLEHEIIYSHFVGENIYVTMYNLTMECINLNNTKRTEEKKKRVRSTHSTPETKDTRKRKQIMRFYEEGKFPKLWQSAGGMLMLGNKIIAHQFLELIDISNSYEEYQFREMKDFTPVKYELSACRCYLLGRENIDNCNDNEGLTILRSKILNWELICQLNFRPEINPYWTAYYSYQKQARVGKKGPGINPNEDRLLVLSFKEREIVVSWIVVKTNSCKKMMLEGNETTCQYLSQVVQIVSLKQVKHSICSVRWVGLCQFLFTEELGEVYFCEFESRFLSF